MLLDMPPPEVKGRVTGLVGLVFKLQALLEYRDSHPPHHHDTTRLLDKRSASCVTLCALETDYTSPPAS